MSKYVLLNDDNIYYVWSENKDDVNVMTLNEYNNGNYDIENIITKKYSNSSIVATDDNLEVLRNLSKSHKYPFKLPKLEDILSGLDIKYIDNRDLSRIAVLRDFIKSNDLHKIGLQLNDGSESELHDSEVLEWNEDNVMKQIREDVDFGFKKALNRISISSSLMAEVIIMWAEILNEKSIIDNKSKYAQYGLPIFKSAALAWGLENPIGDDTGSESKYG